MKWTVQDGVATCSNPTGGTAKHVKVHTDEGSQNVWLITYTFPSGVEVETHYRGKMQDALAQAEKLLPEMVEPPPPDAGESGSVI